MWSVLTRQHQRPFRQVAALSSVIRLHEYSILHALPIMAIVRLCFTAILSRPHRSLAPVYRFVSSSSHPASTDETSKQVTHPDEPDFTMENPFVKEKRQCILCKYKIQLDYKVCSFLLCLFVSNLSISLLSEHSASQSIHQLVHWSSLRSSHHRSLRQATWNP